MLRLTLGIATAVDSSRSARASRAGRASRGTRTSFGARSSLGAREPNVRSDGHLGFKLHDRGDS